MAERSNPSFRHEIFSRDGDTGQTSGNDDKDDRTSVSHRGYSNRPTELAAISRTKAKNSRRRNFPVSVTLVFH